MDRSSIPISNGLYLPFRREHLNKEAHISSDCGNLASDTDVFLLWAQWKSFLYRFFYHKSAMCKVPFPHRKRIFDNADQLSDAIGRLVLKLDTTYAEAMDEIGNLKNRLIAELEAVRQEIGTYTYGRGVAPQIPPP